MSHSNLNPVDPSRPKRAAIVVSNPAVSTSTGWPVGFWWSELTHPHYAYTEAGWQGAELRLQVAAGSARTIYGGVRARALRGLVGQPPTAATR